MLDPISLTTTFAALEGLSAVLGEEVTEYKVIAGNAEWAVVYEAAQKFVGKLAHTYGSENLYITLGAAIIAEMSLTLMHEDREPTFQDAVLRYMSVNIAKSLLI